MSKKSFFSHTATNKKESFSLFSNRIRTTDNLEWEELPEEDRIDPAFLVLSDRSDPDRLSPPVFSLEIVPDHNCSHLHFYYLFEFPFKVRSENFLNEPIDFKFAVIKDIPLFMLKTGTPSFFFEWDFYSGFKSLYPLDNRDIFSMRIDPVIQIHFSDPIKQNLTREIRISETEAEVIRAALQSASHYLDKRIQESSFEDAALEIENRTVNLFYKISKKKLVRMAGWQMKKIEKEAKKNKAEA